MNIVIVGHVDHGKSTIIGRLMADTGSLPENKLEQIQERCRRNSKPFEYAFLLDALKDEQDQGITIDAARCFFKTPLREYMILDAPGHVEFIKNMVTGAAKAEAALLVIDASEGVKENSKRHAYILSMLGIKQLCVLVNKMDLINYSEEKYNEIVQEYSKFLEQIKVKPTCFIPVSGIQGDNIKDKSLNMTWYNGCTVLEQLDLFKVEELPDNKPFRMPVQGVYKFTNSGDTRRIIAGTVESGTLKVGDDVVFYPSGKKSKVKSLESFNAPEITKVTAGYAAAITLYDELYIKRGEVLVKDDELKPQIATKIRASIFWLGKSHLEIGKEYYLKLGTAKIKAEVEKINNTLNASNLVYEEKTFVDTHEVGEIELKLKAPIAFDFQNDVANMGRFVLVDNYEIAGGGIIKEIVANEEEEDSYKKVMLRNYKWEKSSISKEERIKKYKQVPQFILITGSKNCGKKELAKALERKLFDAGRIVYFMGIGNLLYGVDSDIKFKKENYREEHMRRLAEIANLMLDAGTTLIVTAVEMTDKDIDIIKTSIEDKNIKILTIGDYDLKFVNIKLEKEKNLDQKIKSVIEIL